MKPALPRLKRRVTVFGAGAWGTALAAAACDRAEVILWGRRADQMLEMQRLHANATYLPGVALPDNLQFCSQTSRAFDHLAHDQGKGLLVLATPMAGLAQACEVLRTQLASGLKIAGVVWTCKGLLPDSGQLAHELVGELLAPWPELALGVLSGPSFAKEVAQGLPVALTIASQDSHLRQVVTDVFHTDHMRIYGSNDVIGVEVGGALKNVMAIACGISDGLGLGDNARAALITRGLAEMTRFGLALGSQASTFAGLTGLGDLVLTATGDQSRNRQVGLQIGQGRQLSEILAGGLTAEGARCARAVRDRAAHLGVAMPITQAVCDTLFENVTPARAVAHLMSRDATNE